VFRMGVDWSRIMPIEPVNGVEDAVSDLFRICSHYLSSLLVLASVFGERLEVLKCMRLLVFCSTLNPYALNVESSWLGSGELDGCRSVPIHHPESTGSRYESDADSLSSFAS
jgi:hypothetical protein